MVARTLTLSRLSCFFFPASLGTALFDPTSASIALVQHGNVIASDAFVVVRDAACIHPFEPIFLQALRFRAISFSGLSVKKIAFQLTIFPCFWPR